MTVGDGDPTDPSTPWVRLGHLTDDPRLQTETPVDVSNEWGTDSVPALIDPVRWNVVTPLDDETAATIKRLGTTRRQPQKGDTTDGPRLPPGRD